MIKYKEKTPKNERKTQISKGLKPRKDENEERKKNQ